MNKKVLRTAIVTAWAMLLFSFIFKLCGSKAFEIVAVNERFVTICNWLDNDGEIAKYALMLVMYYVSTIFIILASSLKIKLSGKEFILTTILLVAVWIVKLFYPKIGFVVESLELIIVPSILSRKIWTGNQPSHRRRLLYRRTQTRTNCRTFWMRQARYVLL